MWTEGQPGLRVELGCVLGCRSRDTFKSQVQLVDDNRSVSPKRVWPGYTFPLLSPSLWSFPPLLHPLLFHLWFAISLCPDLIKDCHPRRSGELQPPKLGKPQLSQSRPPSPSSSFFSTCVKEIHLFSYLPTMGPFGGFRWKQHNPMFMESMKPGHLNWIECLGLARQPVEEAAASLSPFFLSFGADSRLYFFLKQIKTNRIWWIWKRGKKT